MTKVNTDRSEIDILSIGLIVSDIIVKGVSRDIFDRDSCYCEPVKIACGGDAFNVAYNASKLGAKVALVGCVGGDIWGNHITQQLIDAGINTDGIVTRNQLNTATSVVLVEPNGMRHFAYNPGANDTLEVSCADKSLIERCKVLHIGSALALPALENDLPELFRNAKASGKIITMDVTHDVDNIWLNKIEKALVFVDIFMPSLDEAVLICGTDDPSECVKIFHDLGVKKVIIKMGENGCCASDFTAIRYFDSYKANVVDTTGAGDSFVAGFLTAYLKNYDFFNSVDVGLRAAKICVENIGATGFDLTTSGINACRCL